jgi:hypothetical protein
VHGTTHVDAVSPRNADQLHDEATGGKGSVAMNEETNLQQCAVCEHEVPLSEAVVPEASDYMVHFCGLECYERWRKLAVVFVSSIR